MSHHCAFINSSACDAECWSSVYRSAYMSSAHRAAHMSSVYRAGARASPSCAQERSNRGQIPIQDRVVDGVRGDVRNWALTPIAVSGRASGATTLHRRQP
ncbi:hypothetical protein BH11PSE7_BH11PSE7_26840 [soil metagenome]